VRVVIALLLALILAVGIVGLGELRYRNCVDAATHATPRARYKPSGSGWDASIEHDYYQRRRMLVHCSHSPLPWQDGADVGR
jgi:hypothetical protein